MMRCDGVVPGTIGRDGALTERILRSTRGAGMRGVGGVLRYDSGRHTLQVPPALQCVQDLQLEQARQLAPPEQRAASDGAADSARASDNSIHSLFINSPPSYILQSPATTEVPTP